MSTADPGQPAETVTDRTVPGVTVVVPTRNRAEFMAGILQSILANEYPDFRVIVVDQSDTDATGVVVRAFAEHDARLRYIRQPGTGASRARNLGAREATDQLVAFVDDDCVTPAGWVRSIVEYFERHPGISMVYGQVLQPPDLELGDDALPLLVFDTPRVLEPDEPFVLYGMTANMGIRRAFFEQIGGFDEMLGVGAPLRAGEDFDFQYRAYLAGARVGICPDIVVDHYGVRTTAQWSRVLRDYGHGDAAFYLKHARCGDLRAFGWFVVRTVTVAVREMLLQAGVRRRPPWKEYLEGLWVGIPACLRVRIDRRRRMYVP